MKVREALRAELDSLIADLVGKIDVKDDETELTVNEIFNRAEKNGSFSQNKYIYTEDENTLLEMLTYSLGLSKLFENYKKENPTASYSCVNYLIIDFMKHMWGLEKVPTIRAGRQLERSK